jgi:hypothetical protein
MVVEIRVPYGLANSNGQFGHNLMGSRASCIIPGQEDRADRQLVQRYPRAALPLGKQLNRFSSFAVKHNRWNIAVLTHPVAVNIDHSCGSILTHTNVPKPRGGIYLEPISANTRNSSQQTNSIAYDGPTPPPGFGPHRYFFQILP